MGIRGTHFYTVATAKNNSCQESIPHILFMRHNKNDYPHVISQMSGSLRHESHMSILLRESSLDVLPAELLHIIASCGQDIYCTLVKSYPRFARLITAEIRLEYMTKFGFDYYISAKSTRWTRNGKLHRADGPAIMWTDGDCEYYINDERHRTDGPATIWKTIGCVVYYIRGKPPY